MTHTASYFKLISSTFWVAQLAARSNRMESFDLCTGCHCHIKRRETHCPFCGTPHVDANRAAPRNVARMSRGRWLVIGSTLTFMSCNDNTPPPSVDASKLDAARFDAWEDIVGTSMDAAMDRIGVHDAGADGHDAGESDDGDDFDAGAMSDAADDRTAADAVIDGSDDAADASDAADVNPDVSADAGRDASHDAGGDGGPDGAYFACCRSALECRWCSRKTQICDITYIPGVKDPPCYTLDGGALGSFPEQCMPEPTCACIRPFFAGCGSGPSSTWACGDDGGGIVLSCNGCYGSPPVRWERFVDPPLGAVA
jgi:hypothetical protein